MNDDEEKFISIDRIIEGVFIGLFRGQRNKTIVSWARKRENIPLTCQKCGAVFYTKNIGYIGLNTIYFGTNHDACRKCKHHIIFLKPDMVKHARKKFG